MPKYCNPTTEALVLPIFFKVSTNIVNNPMNVQVSVLTFKKILFLDKRWATKNTECHGFCMLGSCLSQSHVGFYMASESDRESTSFRPWSF